MYHRQQLRMYNTARCQDWLGICLCTIAYCAEQYLAVGWCANQACLGVLLLVPLQCFVVSLCVRVCVSCLRVYTVS